MSALHLMARDDTLGTVVIRDEREDGTVVFLQCADAARTGVVAPSSRIDQAANEVYPIARKQARAATRRLGRGEDFEVILDTSRMPGGPLKFLTDEFTEAARRHSGRGVVMLDTKSAKEWGFRGQFETAGDRSDRSADDAGVVYPDDAAQGGGLARG